ncbi:MAG: pilus assembly protein PilM [Candidatus Omnitrophica bacterium]|nr:pilus assembly protein PilM [Candidatus Omnitrophota bacterium]
MDKKHNLGFFWGEKGFSLVESNKGHTLQIKHIPFDTPLANDQAEEIPEGLKYTALIQKALGEMEITPQFINLSLPNKDLIFRSFVIPWMQPKEVKNVVEFEATKYIPIKLEDLSYTYHSVTISENNQKNLLILFVAIRKNTMEKYVGVFEHSGLRIDNMEPAAVSLSRALHKYGHVSRNQTNAVIELGQDTGKIVIIDREVVHFVRNFPLQADNTDLSSINTQIANDIRVSLNFYTRQNPKAKIDKFVLISLLEFTQLAKSLSDEFGKPASSITAAKIMKNKNINDIGILNAFGISIRDKSFSTKNFDLSDKATNRLLKGEDVSNNEPNYKVAAGIVLFSFLLTASSWFLSHHLIKDLQNKSNALKTQQGVFESSDKAGIEKMTKDIANKFVNYRDIRNNSNVKAILAEIPKLLPQGTWLKKFNVVYREQVKKENKMNRTVSKMEVRLEGYAFLEESNLQLKLVNLLVSKLKNNELFKQFDNIELINVRQEKLSDVIVTSYRINCAQN